MTDEISEREITLKRVFDASREELHTTSEILEQVAGGVASALARLAEDLA